MSSSRDITHRGKVVGISGDGTVDVEIVSESACGSCHARGLCGLAESKVKTVTVPGSGWDNLSPGDDVEVVLTATMGYKAVWLAYVVPLAILVAVMACMSLLGAGELCTGLSAIASVAVYYFIIWLMRAKLSNQYIFKIRKQ